ncbi:energy transducer TonB family protein [Hyalangium rubrum]|uniref:Energy transducer TonB n=1 Tax=Hyalangium rubrum TaxID=3103134 RepID=A0ABU5H963_9BACT|nr:energy transducer TonB [Hyalangium sp. s54d21]MDY7230015.1 energy transducer TonB [Hyalangium sp. s54d21]
MRRSRLGWAGLISLLLHAALLGLLWERAPVRRESAPPEEPPPLVVEILTPPAEPPAPPPPLAKPLPPSPKARPERPKPPPPAPRPEPLPPEPVRAPEPSAPEPPASPLTEPAEPSEPEPPAAEALPEPAEPPAVPEEAPPASAAPEPPAAAEPPPALATAPPPDAPLEPKAQRPSLLPSSPDEGWSLPAPEAPRGRTLYPDDPSLSPEALKAEEQARVSARVQTWAEDDLAKLRVENGLVHPYFSEIRTSLEKQLENAPLFEAQKTMKDFAQRMARSYMKGAQQYGATGTTGRPPAERGGPTARERFEALSQGNPTHDRMRAFLAAGEAMQELAESDPDLVVIVEMQQGPEGQLRSVKVVEPSGNKAFDRYVLEAVPPALTKLAPPPSQAMGVRPEGIRTLWAVEGRVVYLKRLSEMKGEDAWYVASAASLGVLSGRFEETTGDIYVIDIRNPKFVVRPRLLRVW